MPSRTAAHQPIQRIPAGVSNRVWPIRDHVGAVIHFNRAQPVHTRDSAPHRAPFPGQRAGADDSLDGGLTVPHPNTWRTTALAGLALCALYVALPYGSFISGLYVLTTLAAGTAVGAAALRRPRPFRNSAWVCIAGALLLVSIGHGIWYWLDLRGLEPFPSLADATYLAVYPLFIAALWLLGPRHHAGEGAFIDALVITVSTGVLGWVFLIDPYVYDTDLGLLQLVISTAYPVGDLALLPFILRLLFLYRSAVTAHLLLFGAIAAYFLADLLYAHGNSAGWYGPGGLTDALWLLSYTAFAAAAWHPSAYVEPPIKPDIESVSRRHLYILGVAAILVPTVILFMADTDTRTVRIAAIASILTLILVLNRMAGLLKKTQQQAEALEPLTRIDPLTGASNRRHLEEILTLELERAQRQQTPLSLGFLDLDHFKRFNDRHGHAEGDILLRSITTAWRDTLRTNDALARFGGEEFIVLFPDTDVESARRILERMRALIPRGQTCSVGLAAYQAGETAEEMIRRADRALYRAKAAGRDRIALAPDNDPEPATVPDPARAHSP